MAHWTGDVKHGLGGHEGSKHPKKIERIVHRHSTNGDHIFEHHHTHPDHHPMETHTKRGDDEMVAHMLENAGGQSADNAEAPPANADPSAGAAPAAAPAVPIPGGSGIAG